MKVEATQDPPKFSSFSQPEPVTKLEVARRHLGTALDLFLKRQDPISIHTLACAGGEAAEAEARKAGTTTMQILAHSADASKTPGEWRDARNKFWNAFKHSDFRSKSERDDDVLLRRFSETVNEEWLCVGRVDYSNASGTLPLEAQVFVGWTFATRPNVLAVDVGDEFLSQ